MECAVGENPHSMTAAGAGSGALAPSGNQDLGWRNGLLSGQNRAPTRARCETATESSSTDVLRGWGSL